MRRRRRALSITTALAAAVAGAGVAAPAAGADPSPPEYVQLGDSYSAGNGTGSYSEPACWRSPENYGERVAERDGAEYTNAACSGGVVADILEPRELGDPTTRTATYDLPGRAPNVTHHWLRQARQQELCGTTSEADLSYDITITTSRVNGTGKDRSLTATAECQLTAAPQIDSVTKDTDAVFLTVGGNDIGFTDIVVQCMVLRSAAGCEQTIDRADAAIPRLKKDTKEALAAVHERSGGRADIYLLGYPYLLDTDRYGIPEADPTYDAGAELDAMQEEGDRVQREGMAELAATTKGAGDFTFVDVKPAWEGHAHGLDPRSTPDNSDAWLVPVLAPGRQQPEWVHPTVDGYAASATALIEAMD